MFMVLTIPAVLLYWSTEATIGWLLCSCMWLCGQSERDLLSLLLTQASSECSSLNDLCLPIWTRCTFLLLCEGSWAPARKWVRVLLSHSGYCPVPQSPEAWCLQGQDADKWKEIPDPVYPSPNTLAQLQCCKCNIIKHIQCWENVIFLQLKCICKRRYLDYTQGTGNNCEGWMHPTSFRIAPLSDSPLLPNFQVYQNIIFSIPFLPG